MPKMLPAWGHNAQVGHSTPETILDTWRPQTPLRGTSKWWGNARERETEGWGHNKERQDWRLEGSVDQPDVMPPGATVGS